MYLQITSKCNMSCDHCCMSCEPGKGEHMSMEVFRACLEYLQDDYTVIGGGEPTIHPKFWDILGRCIGVCEDVFIVTNGSMTQTTVALAKMARRGVIGVDLSRDNFHDPIDEEAFDAFDPYGSWPKDEKRYPEDRRGIRDVTNGVKEVGRAVETGVAKADGCVCDETFIDVHGKIHVCGCPGAPIIGDVWDGISDWDWESGECYRDQIDDDDDEEWDIAAD